MGGINMLHVNFKENQCPMYLIPHFPCNPEKHVSSFFLNGRYHVTYLNFHETRFHVTCQFSEMLILPSLGL